MALPTAVFFGSPDAAVPALDALSAVARVTSVVTRPDAVRGRGRSVQRTPVAEAAERLGIPVRTPTTTEDLYVLDLHVDVAIVVAFGMIIPEPVLRKPRVGFLNLHFSLLPAWRGAAPVERAILSGDPETGVCLMRMEEGLDTGPVYATQKLSIGRRDAGALTEELSTIGADLLSAHLARIIDGSLTPVGQEGASSYAAKLTASEGRLSPFDGTAELDRRIRALTPRPGAFFETDAGRLKVWEATPVNGDLPPGAWGHSEEGVALGTADGVLLLRTVQPEGSRRMDARAWLHGRRGEPPALLA